ncbi:MAG: DUF4124 domain-containing protein, partial [bacterium]|nr:DUF4124 domain-containing protein [bacterium]
MRPVLALLAFGFLATAVHADIYRWTDAQGQVHFTQDFSKVPVAQRSAAKQAAGAEAPSRVQTYSRPTPAVSRRVSQGLVHIRYEQQ